jgi:hypothetical protein
VGGLDTGAERALQRSALYLPDHARASIEGEREPEPQGAPDPVGVDAERAARMYRAPAGEDGQQPAAGGDTAQQGQDGPQTATEPAQPADGGDAPVEPGEPAGKPPEGGGELVALPAAERVRADGPECAGHRADTPADLAEMISEMELGAGGLR